MLCSDQYVAFLFTSGMESATAVNIHLIHQITVTCACIGSPPVGITPFDFVMTQRLFFQSYI